MDFKTWYRCKFKGYKILRIMQENEEQEESRYECKEYFVIPEKEYARLTRPKKKLTIPFLDKFIKTKKEESESEDIVLTLPEESVSEGGESIADNILTEMPIHARKCRGEPFYWSLNNIENKNDGHDEYGYSGSNAWRFLHTDVFDNLLSGLWKEGDHINLKKILLIVGVVVVAVILAYVLFGGGGQ